MNVKRLLEGSVFEPLKKRAFFGKVKLDPLCGTVCWPNGADLAPDALYERLHSAAMAK